MDFSEQAVIADKIPGSSWGSLKTLQNSLESGTETPDTTSARE